MPGAILKKVLKVLATPFCALQVIQLLRLAARCVEDSVHGLPCVRIAAGTRVRMVVLQAVLGLTTASNAEAQWC